MFDVAEELLAERRVTVPVPQLMPRPLPPEPDPVPPPATREEVRAFFSRRR